MIISFRDKETEDIFDGNGNARARRRLPEHLWSMARRKLDALNSAPRLEALRSPPGTYLEALKDDRTGQHSIRINKQYRVCFVWTDAGPEDVEVTDYH